MPRYLCLIAEPGPARSNRGTLIVLSLIAGAVVVAVIAVAGFLLTAAGSNIRCDEGQASVNPTNEAGVTLPLSRDFQTIEDAEAFICHRVPHPRDTQGLELQRISGTRARSLGDVIEREGFASVVLDYRMPGSGTGFRLEVSPFELPPLPPGTAESVGVNGVRAQLVRLQGDGVALEWRKDDLHFQAGADLDGGFGLDDLLHVLDTTE